ncbi:MAG: hypothetical protein ACM3TR_14570 [Caulobacteraceae bacterium]
MKKKLAFLILILVFILAVLSGCSENAELRSTFDIPEAGNIQQALDNMSDAVVARDLEKYAIYISELCPRRTEELNTMKAFISSNKLKTYSQSIKKAKRLKDGVVCTVETFYEGVSKEKNVSSRYSKDIYFIFESGTWKIADYNYYPYMNPTVVVGSDSTLYDAASSLSQTLAGELKTDSEHLQTYGNIILVGTPYDNASILDLEERGLTYVKVTDEYPGSNAGIVQVLINADNYRHAVIIQGSNISVAEDTLKYMTQYLSENPYMNPGVYFVENDRLKKASPLELTTLTTLDMSKTEQRIKEVQKHVETNLELIQEEIQLEKEQLAREIKYVSSPFKEDYHEVFERYGFNEEQAFRNSMILINSDYTDAKLCTSIFELPYGNKPGTVYAYTNYIYKKAAAHPDETQIKTEALLKGTDIHVFTADEMNGLKGYEDKIISNEYEASCYGTAMLRLEGFSENEAFNALSGNHASVFCNIGSGYAVGFGSPVPYTSEIKYRTGEISSIQNEGGFIDFKGLNSNLGESLILQIAANLAGPYDLSKKLSEEKLSRTSFKESESEQSSYLPYSAADIYSLLRTTFITDDTTCIYSTLGEAREKLRLAMGELLSVKNMRFLVSNASRYPGSQFDYALYAAGLINVEYPSAYAEAAERSRLINKLYGGISNVLSNDDEKIQKIIDILSEITDVEKKPEEFFFPDFTIANKTGSHADKALLAFGLYSSLLGDTKDTYIAIGENNSYLAFKAGGQWEYIDCKYNTLKDFITEDIYLAFNKGVVYNENLGIGDKPEFLR